MSARLLLSLYLVTVLPPAGVFADDAVVAFDLRPDVEVLMRDGVKLKADLYLPEGPGPFPVLVYRTPYGKHAAAEDYQTHLAALARGYAVMLQDVRGRYASDGVFEPYRNEGRDGFDSIEWAAGQPWSNGRVGTYGLSYPGAVQWLAALESPPHLVAMAPAMTYASPGRFFYMNGLFDLSWLPWTYVNIAPDVRRRSGIAGPRTVDEAARAWPAVAAEYLGFRPLAELPWLRGVAPWYYQWLRHDPTDAYWDWARLEGRYDRVDAAVLNLSGWHDEAYGPDGAIANHRGLVAARGREDAQSHLLLGPWMHGVAALASRRFGVIDFGAEAPIDYDATLMRFFDEYINKHETGLGDEAPVRFFVMGANVWETAREWPQRNAHDTDYCLGTGSASGGRLAPCPVESDAAASTFVSDPAAPVEDPHGTFGPHDYASLSDRDDVLTFDSRILRRPVRMVGEARARLYLSCECADFDVWLKLLDVHPDGRAMSLMSPGAGIRRASYDPLRNERVPIEPGQVYELEVGGMITANEFAAGHRIRLQVFASFAPHFAQNLQTGVSEATSSRVKAAKITLYHNEEHRSALVLPLIQ